MLDTRDQDGAALCQQLGQAATELLNELVTPTDVLGLAWARTVSAMATELRRLPAIPVVQLTGALSRSTESSSSIEDDSYIDVVREVARISGGPAYLFFAPFLVPDGATAQAMRRQPDVARALTRSTSSRKPSWDSDTGRHCNPHSTTPQPMSNGKAWSAKECAPKSQASSSTPTENR